MKERPILMSAPMVRAILSGTKTQTRRVVKPQPYLSTLNPPNFEDKKVGEIFICPDLFDPKTSVFVEYEGGGRYHNMGSDVFARKHCPYGQPGDRLWVREAFAFCCEDKFGPVQDSIIFRADEGNADWKHGWRPSIHMPRAASRILLEIVSVRVERLHEISEADAIAEGCPSGSYGAYYPVDNYARLWESINGPESWESNPWVWVVEFRRLA